VFGTLHITLNLIEKVEPNPTTLYTFTVPPICSTIDLQIDNPRPLPEGLVLRCSSKLLKFMKRLFSLSGGIPQPKSLIAISKVM
jgi:hypothetical protein